MTAYRVFIAGRSGQVARELVRQAPAGIEIKALGRPELDVTDASAVARIIREWAPDFVINAAAYTAVDQAETDEAEAFRLNADAPGYLAQAAAGLGVPFLHISTDYVFDGTKSDPYTEIDPVVPLGAYGRSKLAGEGAALAANANSIILRTSWVYSPFGKNFVKTMLRLASARDEVGVVHDQRGNPTSAAEIARGIWSIVTDIRETRRVFRPGLYHMSGAGEASWAEFAEAIFKFSRELDGPVASVRRITSDEYPTPVKRPADSRLDCSKLSKEYGVILPDWRVSAQECVAELIRTEGWQA